RNTLCWRLCRWCTRLWRRCWRAVVELVRILPMTWRTILFAAGILGIQSLMCLLILISRDGFFFFLITAALDGVLVVGAALLSLQLQKVRDMGSALAAGDLEAHLDTETMYFDVKRHAEDLNAIGVGMNKAVEQRLKSERLKTELITNVSHDIKTPLTSIVNYVDLLKKEDLPPAAGEYLSVLDRQANRLKKLTEDLVEASKASTGNITVSLEPIVVNEIIHQAIGDYDEKLAAGKLEVIVNTYEGNLMALADGRLLWRVLDNLLSNVCKYALAGTRVYVDLGAREGKVVLSVKNISRDPLNVSAEELMERFVRGDASRHTEGSGLGLNIARSLMALMGGGFELYVDGDLFKAELTLRA
ncbi:MAG: HAMP domain-containing histidine kinase, partial [Oscillospiraceae bacterium]|nr:HAMP domain-containing histidine kinase [Oscillospiraceae bacterium]